MDRQMSGIEPEKCGGATTVWDMGLLEVPCECQYVGSRGPKGKDSHTPHRGEQRPLS